MSETERVFCDDCKYFHKWYNLHGYGHGEDCSINPVKTKYKYDSPYYRYATPKKKNKHNDCGDYAKKKNK